MAERVRLLVAEDDSSVLESIIHELTLGGHIIVAKAKNVEEIQKLVDSGLDVTVAVVDGSMPKEGDGMRAAKIIRQIPGVIIVSFSSDIQTFGDKNLLKKLGPRGLSEIITSL